MTRRANVGDINETAKTLDEYRILKIQMLEREFMLPLKKDEKQHMMELKSEAEIDRFARTILQKRWG
jgi:hypothetical protein